MKKICQLLILILAFSTTVTDAISVTGILKKGQTFIIAPQSPQAIVPGLIFDTYSPITMFIDDLTIDGTNGDKFTDYNSLTYKAQISYVSYNKITDQYMFDLYLPDNATLYKNSFTETIKYKIKNAHIQIDGKDTLRLAGKFYHVPRYVQSAKIDPTDKRDIILIDNKAHGFLTMLINKDLPCTITSSD